MPPDIDLTVVAGDVIRQVIQQPQVVEVQCLSLGGISHAADSQRETCDKQPLVRNSLGGFGSKWVDNDDPPGWLAAAARELFRGWGSRFLDWD